MTPPDSANIAANESARPFPPSSGVHLARGRQGQLDLLFVSMPSRSNEVSVPLAFLMLAGFLDKHSDFTSEILEIKIPAYLDRTPQRLADIEEELIRQMIQKDPRLIAFSLFPGDLPAFLSGNGFHIYLQTSRYEGLCLTLVEGMAQGLAVITTAAGGIADYAEDGVNCLICPMESPEALAERVERLALDPLLHQRLAAGALQTVRDRFSPESQARSVAALLERINRAKEHGT
ncbi:MAG: glycosyltransferase family 4 protein [Magnetococcales bacterium]|nr:glycosyltransferase family 4 protein [Magnetococcales bacterium]